MFYRFFSSYYYMGDGSMVPSGISRTFGWDAGYPDSSLQTSCLVVAAAGRFRNIDCDATFATNGEENLT